jgi:glycosyltransferase involved in cell wall biosynthesis
MRIAFHAPMKPPDDPVISGDRETARLILKALTAEGHAVEIASRLRTWLPRPDPQAFEEVRAAAAAETSRLMERWRNGPAPDLWLTYHLYHKAPDLIGPVIARALGIPYLVIEGCRAAKQAAGPWAAGFAAADRALAAADVVAALHAEDAEGLAGFLPSGRLHRLAPFIDAARFAAAAARPRTAAVPVLVVVAMMRAGDKERSYRLLAAALGKLAGRAWRLLVAGDGPCREEILGLFPAARVDWRGVVEPDAIASVYGEGDVLAWPAVNEAFGVALLEAQAAGLPVVAGASGGVPDIVLDGRTGLLVPEGDTDAFAGALARYLDDPDLRRRHGAAAVAHVASRHDLAAGRRALAALIDAAASVHRGRKAETVP